MRSGVWRQLLLIVWVRFQRRLGLECCIHSAASFVIGLGNVLSKPAVCNNLMAAWACGLGRVHGDGRQGR